MTPIPSLDAITPGQVFEFGTLTLSEAEIIAFATLYDPQPFHIDPVAAKDSLFGELIASGLHTLSACFGRIMGSGVFGAISEGGNRIDTRWPAPLRPNETIVIRTEVLETKPSRTGRPLGVAVLRHTATRLADGVVVMEATGTHFLRR
ncbi:MaoC/PaaZ C-terminal domain-containing protein [Plastoroseomonas arctica]|uniref:Acyl dehydratase n=1 Tax=Plastoroseomonas arctica TaxID=1509237 RepID=A0AAF1KM95_9PROT|nr:MaoC/PaaZ C-terminal domain-containing protein [Plastoroseomonas arctica]MBR0656051.1 acyl dehydratase [Plastoroseomonas arctica]